MSFVFVGRDVNICRADQFNQLLRSLEPVSEDHAVLNSEIAGQLLQVQPIFLAFVTEYMGMGDTGNHVNNIAVA